jgi:DNA-binding LacI/PurR family transcriptional regulator
MQTLSFVPLQAARHLATRKTGMVGLLSFTVKYVFLSTLLTGLEQVLKENGYNLLVATYQPEPGEEAALPFGPHNADGVVVFSNTLSEERLAEWHSMDFPVVLMHHTSLHSLSIPSVNVENEKASFQIVEHLIKVHGRKKIAFVRAPGHQQDAQSRELAYKAALKANSIAFDTNLVISGNYDRDAARQAMQEFLVNHHPRFDAVFASDDDLAVSAISALQNAGLRVPEDVAVVGFDDQRFAAQFVPPLTTVHAPTEHVGRVAGLQLLRLLRGQPAEAMTLLPTELIIRQSCGCS